MYATMYATFHVWSYYFCRQLHRAVTGKKSSRITYQSEQIISPGDLQDVKR